MSDKIKVLFYTKDIAGVNYFRISTPAKALEKYYSSDFEVTVLNLIDFKRPDIVEYLSGFNIIYYSKQFNENLGLLKTIKEKGTKFIIDVDDYWRLDKSHPMYFEFVKNKVEHSLLANIKFADYVVTTTNFLAEKLKKVTQKNNVVVFENSIDESLMPQFENNWKPDPNGLVRITYMAGSSHGNDIKLLRGVINLLMNNEQTRDRFKIILAGWDIKGNKIITTLNEDFKNDLVRLKLWTPKVIKEINKAMGDVSLIPSLPSDMKTKYMNKIFIKKEEALKPEESIYYEYEKILTDNHKLIKSESYLNWLKIFEKNIMYHNEDNFARRWTKPANEYAYVLDETDIVLAPLANTEFNNGKSELKQIECWTRKLPIVSSDVLPYNVYGVNEKNCILVNEKFNPSKYWFKALKKLITDSNLRKELGENLYNDFSQRFNLKTVTDKRADFLKNVING